jgi:hypothetical protein
VEPASTEAGEARGVTSLELEPQPETDRDERDERDDDPRLETLVSPLLFLATPEALHHAGDVGLVLPLAAALFAVNHRRLRNRSRHSSTLDQVAAGVCVSQRSENTHVHATRQSGGNVSEQLKLVATRWDALFDEVRDAVRAITPKEFGFRVNVQPSYLNDVLRGVERKRFLFEWLPDLVEMAPDENVERVVGTIAGWRRYDLKKRPELSAEAELAAYKAAVAKAAPAVALLAEQEVSKRR